MNQKLIIGAAVIVLLVVLGGGGWYFYSEQGQELEGLQQAPAVGVGESTPSIDQGEPQQGPTDDTGEIAPIVDVDDILHKRLSEVTPKMGEPGETSSGLGGIGGWASWERGGALIRGVQRKELAGPFSRVNVEFFEGPQIRLEDALRAVGIEALDAPPRRSLLSWYWEPTDRYGGISFSDYETLGGETSGVRKEALPTQITVLSRDERSEMDLGALSSVLDEYRDRYGATPSSDGKLILWNSKNAETTLLAKTIWIEYYQEEGVRWPEYYAEYTPTKDLKPTSIPRFPLPVPGTSFGYKSDGSTYYELSAALDDSSHPECVIEGNLCIYRIRNGEVVSRK